MSEELRERFGEIYVDTTYQDNKVRLGFLRRKSDGAVLTYHEVHFDLRGVKKMGSFHEEIVNGSLLGETIKRSGLLHERSDSDTKIRSVPKPLADASGTQVRRCKSKTVLYTVENEPYVRIEEYYNPDFTPA